MAAKTGLEKIKSSAKVVATLTALSAALVLMADIGQEFDTIDSDLQNLQNMDYVPNIKEQECLYIHPDQEVNVRYSGSNHYLFTRILLPLFTDSSFSDGGFNNIVGTLPAYGFAPCDVLKDGLSPVFKTTAEALVAEKENSAKIVARLQELKKRYPEYQRVAFEPSSMK